MPDFLNFEQWFIVASALILLGVIFNVAKLILFFIKRVRKPEKIKSAGVEQELEKMYFFRNFFKKYLIIIINFLLIIPAILIFLQLFSPKPYIESTFPSNGGSWTSYEEPVQIVFDRPIITKKLKYNMSPKVKGEWKFKPALPFFPFTRTLHFFPDESFWPNEDILIYISYISNWANPDPGNEYLLSFQTAALPEITGISIKDDQIDTPVNSNIEFFLNKKDGPYNKWEVEIMPEIDFSLTQAENGMSQTITFANQLNQGTQYFVKIFQKAVTYNLKNGEIISEGERNLVKELNFTTVKTPLVSFFAPLGKGVFPDANVVIEFDQEMDTISVESNFSILPQTAGKITWNEDKKMLTFDPESLVKDTSYIVTIAKGMRSKIGGIIEADLTYEFRTIGAVNILSISPAHNSTDAPINTSVSITFDQPVDHNSAESNFSIQPHLDGTFSWNRNTMIFRSNINFNYNQSYQIALNSGIKSIYGNDSNIIFTYRFTTKPQLVLIDIVWDGQDTPWTCNFAATKMALSVKGVSVSENTLIDLATIQPSFNFSTMSGGNPHKGFVNNYGTYWEPISRAVSNFRPNMVKTGWTIPEVCSEIANGNPIVTWGQNGWSTDTPRNWTAPDGEYIIGYSGMHSMVVRGCLGDINNPSHIYVQDPWRKWGEELTVSEFLRRWAYFNNTGMVVY